MAEQVSSSKIKIVPLLISILIPISIGVTASFSTRPEIAGWYSFLQKPSFNPPPWLFAPVWTLLYIMMGIAAYLVWNVRDSKPAWRHALIIYAVQLVLNFSWSIVFFGNHQILAALVVIVLLWISIIINIVYFGRYSKTAAWLLVPYLLWVSFASILNLSIYLLNGY